ncbi:MAG: helix-turn-helix transcriptional regulator [Chloroflexi bacterium]|nr:helix-turn-helix transcriptional regulator [Chloroflexota bacterium]
MMNNKFGECLREARLEKRLSQFELAVKTGISPKSIHLYERGKTVPRFNRVKVLARALRKPVSYFLSE